MNRYTPRRAGMRWREDAPEFILDCFDNRGDSCDRYTVLFCGSLMISDGTRAGTWIQYLCFSGAPSHPQGISMWGEMRPHEAANYRYSFGRWRIRWLDLPDDMRAHVIARATEE